MMQHAWERPELSNTITNSSSLHFSASARTHEQNQEDNKTISASRVRSSDLLHRLLRAGPHHLFVVQL